MAVRRKWNPATNRFEVTGDNILDNAWNTSGTVPATTTTAPKPKAPQGPVAPKGATTTSVPRTTTSVPATTTTGAPTTTTSVPSASSAHRKSKGAQGPAAPKGATKGGRGTSRGATAEGYNIYQIQSALQNTKPEGLTDEQWATLLTSLTGTSAGGGSGAGAAAKGLAGYVGGMQAAAQQEAAGREAQAMYGQMAGTNYNAALQDIAGRYAPQLEALNKYYTGAGAGALQGITDATTQAKAGLGTPTAYQDLQSALLSAPQQALDLTQYGASTEAAAKQQATDAETAKFISDLIGRGYKQTQAVNQDYMTALKNAVSGSEEQAKGQLATTLAGLQAADIGNLRSAQQTEVSNAAAMRDQLVKAGIEALMSGKQTAASTRANTAASYGAYKPKKKKSK